MGKILYKYTNAEYFDSILENGGMLKLSDPSSFIDPNDCNFSVCEENLSRSFRMLTNVAFVCEFFNNPRYGKIKILSDEYKIIKKDISLTHIYEENPGINMIIKKCLKDRKPLNDLLRKSKSHFNETFTNIIETLKKRSLIGCLTPDNSNNLMWSHYANGHQGICIEYEFDDENELLNVVYSDNINNFDLYTVLKYIIPGKYFNDKNLNEMNQKLLDACYLPFLIKTKEWSYENEVRMIFNLNENSNIVNNSGIWFYPNVKVKSIYIGCRMDKSKREEIESKCRELNISIHHMMIEKGNNKLIIKD